MTHFFLAGLLLTAQLFSGATAQAATIKADDAVIACLRKLPRSPLFVLLTLDKNEQTISTWTIGNERSTFLQNRIDRVHTGKDEIIVGYSAPKTIVKFDLSLARASVRGEFDPDDVEFYPECTSFDLFEKNRIQAWGVLIQRGWKHGNH